MFNGQKYIESIVLQYSIQPPEYLKKDIWQILENICLEEKGDLNELPLLNKYSSPQLWMKILKPLLPQSPGEDIFIKVIRDDEEVMQTIIWSRVDYPDEVHDDLHESIMVLEGECECHIGDKVIRVGAGGYFEIPVHTHHDVKILTPHVLAIVQRKKIA